MIFPCAKIIEKPLKNIKLLKLHFKELVVDYLANFNYET